MMPFAIHLHSTFKDALLSLGYTYQDFTLDSTLYRTYRAPNGWTWIYGKMYRNYPFISISAREISANKLASYDFAQLHGVTIPKTLHTSDEVLAAQFLENYKRVIVKPLDQSGGAGLTIDITTNEQLRTAMDFANGAKSPVLVQQQFIGEELRFTVLKGKVESVILRRSARVVGNSIDSVKKLIEIENTERESLRFPLLSYPLLDATNIVTSQLTNQDVPSDGEIVQLNKSTMIKSGASFYGVSEKVHKSYVTIAENLAQSLNSAMLVVDLMISDYKTIASPTNYVFLEFNTAPAPQIYTSIRAGDQPAIIDKIVAMIDEYATTYGPSQT